MFLIFEDLPNTTETNGPYKLDDLVVELFPAPNRLAALA